MFRPTAGLIDRFDPMVSVDRSVDIRADSGAVLSLANQAQRLRIGRIGSARSTIGR